AARPEDPQGTDPSCGRGPARGRVHRSALDARHPKPDQPDRRRAGGSTGRTWPVRLPHPQENIKSKDNTMAHRCAILDDYQNVATKLADWSIPEVEVKVFNEPFADRKAAVAALKGFSIICMMRERTPFLKPTLEQLPDLKLLLTSGARNASIDLDYAAERGITVCGTEAAGQPTAELAVGIMLELARKIGYENNRMKSGVPWQSTLGIELAGKTLGLLGFGKLGTKVGEIGKAIGMKLIAWSENLTEEKAKAGCATLVSKQDLFRQADFL